MEGKLFLRRGVIDSSYVSESALKLTPVRGRWCDGKLAFAKLKGQATRKWRGKGYVSTTFRSFVYLAIDLLGGGLVKLSSFPSPAVRPK